MRERLYRSRTDRMLFGVAGGMADWLDLDPALVRLVWALLILAGGVGLLLYIVAAIVIPEEPLGAMPPYAPTPGAAAPDGGSGPGPASAGPAAPMDRDAWRAQRRAARAEHRGNGALVFGVVLVLLGGWFLLERYVHIDSSIVLPGALIVLGAALVVGAMGRRG